MTDRDPLLMIPGPVELSPAVLRAQATPPPSHTSAELIAAFGRCLRAMRAIWGAPDGALPVILAGSGTLAMEAAVWNCAAPGRRALVVDTGFFSDRMARMLSRRGVSVDRVSATPGCAVPAAQVAAALDGHDLVAVTHVDTSTGVRADVQGIAAAARAHGALVVVDGVCATGAEPLHMARDGVDVVLTASQKALGAPPGLALAVFSPRALEAHAALSAPPPLGLDLASWRPIMEAYEAGRPSYFGTPATSLVLALDDALAEILALDEGGRVGVEAAWARHARVGEAMRAAWRDLGLELVPASEDIAANTLSAIRYPDGVGPELVGRIAARGVVVAGGLHPAMKDRYFRVGHMGWVSGRPGLLERAVDAVRAALAG